MLQPELATATAEPCPAPACQPSVPSVTALPPFRDKEALEMRQDLVHVDGEGTGGRSRGALALKSQDRFTSIEF